MTRVEFCSNEAATYAVTRWHYSKVMPAGKKITLGAWEHDSFVGAVIFSAGATHKLAEQWGLLPTQACEMTRVAFREHENPVSQTVAQALKILKRTNPGLRLVVSFADPEHDHHGGIYQAGNWLYTGRSASSGEFIVRGVQMHARSVHAKGWKQTQEWLRANVDQNALYVRVPGKHRYLMPLDKSMRRRLLKSDKIEDYPSKGE